MEIVRIALALAGTMAMVMVVRPPALTKAATRYFVAIEGRDSWSGKLAAPNRQRTDGPFATLERARDEIRKRKAKGALPRGGVTVEVGGGTYERERPFELTAADSGTAAAPVVYRAAPGATVRLVGGKIVTGFQPVTEASELERLEPAARGKVLQTDLRAQGIREFGSVKGGGLELFFQERPMTLARWPNQGFVRIVDVTGGDPVDVRGTKGDKIGRFTYAGDRPARWVGEQEIWLHGYWFWDWSDERQPVAAIDTARREIRLASPHHRYGYRKGQWYYAFNLLAELDEPGEWFLDRQSGILYFWPPAPITSGRPTVSVSPSLVTLREASHVTLRGMILEAVRGTALTITGGAHCQVVGCTLRDIGGWAVKVADGEQHAVIGCNITATGEGGIALAGGDRPALTPAGHVAENNHIHHYSRWNRMYQPAISLSGVGNRAVHNLIHDAPHEAIAFSGNDHLIELNEISNVCLESNDAGAIYSGRDWTMRGTVIRHNYLHHIQGFEGRGCVGVYLDDMFCGTTITGNVFHKVTRAAFIGGGRDNVVENNIFVECQPALHVDARALGWAADSVPSTMMERLRAMPYQNPLWRARYPRLPAILDEEPAAPRGNRVTHNIVQGGRWDEIEARARPLVTLEGNLVDQDVHFQESLNRAYPNLRLRDDSPAYQMGFQRIPFDKIGLYEDGRRASRNTLPFRDAPPLK